MDYGALSTTLIFAACEMRHCDNISIVDDVTLEMTESFSVTLERTPDLSSRITLNPVDGKMNIFDDDNERKHMSMSFLKFKM